MATKYNVFTTDETPIATRAKKDAAIKLGNETGIPFRVVTDTGTVVHEVFAEKAPEQPVDTTSQSDREQLAASNIQTGARNNETPAGEAEEDLLGEQPTAPAAEPEEAEEDVPAPGSKQFDITVMKRKIAALLNKAEHTDNEAERDAFTAKAEKLMLRLGINQAELEAAGTKKAEKVVEQHIDWAFVYAMDMVKLTGAVAVGLGDLVTLQSGKWANARAYIVGHKSDVDLAVKLVKSLELQVFAALKAWQKANKAERVGMSNYDKLVGNRSFIAGFAQTVSARLAEERREVQAEASTGAALVLASKMDRVSEGMKDIFPNVKEGKQGRGARYSSMAMADGRVAGRTANLGEKAVGGAKDALTS